MTLSIQFLQFLLSVIGKNRFYLKFRIPGRVDAQWKGRRRGGGGSFERFLSACSIISLSLSLSLPLPWPNMDRKLPFYYPYYTILPIYLDLRESVKFALLSVNQDALVTWSPLYGLSFRIVAKVPAFSTTPYNFWRFIISILPSCQFI